MLASAFLLTTIITIFITIWFVRTRLAERNAQKLADSSQPSPSSLSLPESEPDPILSNLEVSRPEPVAVGVQAAENAQPEALPKALSKTRASLFGRIQSLFGGRTTLSDSEREDLEEVLYTADLGPKTVQDLLDHVFAKLKANGETGFEAVRRELHAKMAAMMAEVLDETSENGTQEAATTDESLRRLALISHKPAVLMVVGVNGAGKTTTIGKLAAKLAQGGKSVLVAAGDTFRAAAGEQLKVWTDRAGTAGAVEIFDPENVTEPSAVAYQALERARAKGFDVVIVDTAGRLHTQKNLMEELKKMKRVLAKLDETAPHETLLVLDANSGQNALIQAKEFHGALNVDGVVLTKLDGSAKGGVAVGIVHEVRLPIKLIGVGEKIGDLRPFEPKGFVDSILG
ncbi:MAG: signal recognition particle-docking protein FtsY [Bdellovibrionales bacterium]|nr:signal recognition particle-docking protein FtsY [Bdellovibrionales bacterium]